MQPMQTIDSEYKPWGGLAGVYKGEEAANKSFANDMSLGEQSLALEKAANENPLALIMKQRDAAHATQDMSDPMMAARQDLAVGTAQSAKAKGSLDMNALPEKMKLQSLELMGKTSKQEVDNTIAGIEKFITDFSSNGPMGPAMAIQSLPPQMQQMVSKLPPDQILPAAQKLRETLIAMRSFNEEHVRKQAEIAATGVEQRKGIELGKQWDEKFHKMDNASRLEIAKLHESGANARAQLQANRADVTATKGVMLQLLKGEQAIITRTLDEQVKALEKGRQEALPNRELTPKQKEANKAIDDKIKELEKDARTRWQDTVKRERGLLSANTPEQLSKATEYVETPASSGASTAPPIPPGFAPKSSGPTSASSPQPSAAPTSKQTEPKPSSTTPIIPLSMLEKAQPDYSGKPLGGAYYQPWSNLGQLAEVHPNMPEMMDDFTLNQLAKLKAQQQQR